MDFREVYERFLLISGLDESEASCWAVLCREAQAQLRRMLRPNVNEEENGRRLSTAAAALALYKMALCSAGEGITSFKAGDISVTTQETLTARGEAAWKTAKAEISDLLEDDMFFFGRVKP